MARIVWEGNQNWDKEYPEGVPPLNAHRIKRPDGILKASTPYGIIPMLLCCACVFYKRSAASEFPFDFRIIPLSFVLGFLLIPVHEFLHAVCYPANAKVYTGIALKKIAAYAISFCPKSKLRFIVMSLMPIILGIIPLLVFVFTPVSCKIVLTLCVVPMFMGLISPSPDYMDVIHVIKQVPDRAMIQAANDGLYWFE